LKRIIKKIYVWHPTPPFYYGWLVLIIAGFGAFAATGISQTVLGGVQDFIIIDMEWNRQTIALTATAGTWASGFVAIAIGRLVDKHGPRLIMPIATLIVGIGSILLSNSKTLWAFVTIYIIIRAIAGPSLQNLIPRTVAVNFFSKKRNLAMGITTFNKIAGESINLQIITSLASTFSWRIAYKIVGAITIPLCIPILLIVRHKPEDINLLPDGNLNHNSEQTNKQLDDKIWTVKEILKFRSFWFILSGEFIAGASTSMIIFQVVPYLTDAYVDTQTAILALTLGNILGGISVPIWGYLTDKFTTKRIAILIITLAIIPTILLTQLDTQIYGFWLMLIWTTITGSILVLGSMLYGTVFSRKSYGTVAGITGPSRTAAVGLGPTLGASIIRISKSYSPIFFVATIGYGLALVLFSSIKYETHPK
jgi:sugar phosphate permease